MAINATAVWRVRTGGGDTNGAGYDPAISGAGTDYTQQDAAQLTLTDLDCLVANDAGRLVIGSATGGFTSAMIGNAINIQSTGTFTAGLYFITAVGSTNLCTLDRSPAGGADRTGGSGKVGGAALTLKRLMDSSRATGDEVVAGNQIYMRGGGTRDPGTADYTNTGFWTPVSGSAADGPIRVVGENGRPRIDCDGLIFNGGSCISMHSIIMVCSGGGFLTAGFFPNGGADWEAADCKFDTNNKNIVVCNTPGIFIGCEFSGTRTAAAAYDGPQSADYNAQYYNCYFHDFGQYGLKLTGGSGVVVGCIFYNCFGTALFCNGAHSTSFGPTITIMNNTFVGGTTPTNGIEFTSSAIVGAIIVNNIFVGFDEASSVAIKSAGTAAVNDKKRIMCDFNVFFNNTTNYSGLTAGANDQTPGATPLAGTPPTDFSITSTYAADGYPQLNIGGAA